MKKRKTEKAPDGLVFVCPEHGAVFHSTEFVLIENKGIKTDTYGNKVLDAKVELKESCPFCGKKHVYHVSEIPCPFSG